MLKAQRSCWINGTSLNIVFIKKRWGKYFVTSYVNFLSIMGSPKFEHHYKSNAYEKCDVKGFQSCKP